MIAATDTRAQRLAAGLAAILAEHPTERMAVADHGLLCTMGGEAYSPSLRATLELLDWRHDEDTDQWLVRL